MRLALGFAAAAFGLLLVTTCLLYWALANNLDQEDNQYLGDKVATLAELLQHGPLDSSALRAEVERESQQRFYAPVLIRVFGGQGDMVAETRGMAELLPPSAFPKTIQFPAERWSAVDFTTDHGRPFGLLTANVGTPTESGQPVVQIALDQSQEQQLLGKYRKWIWVILELGLVLSAGVGYAIARRGLRPIAHMATTVKQIGSESLNERVRPAGFPPELSSLAITFNDMLQRLEDAFGRLSRFSADIAHELRSPINNVRGLAEVAMGRARAGQDCSELLGPCLEECQRLSRLIDNLLFLARAEHPEKQIERQRLSLRREIETVREFYEATAAEEGVSIDLTGEENITAELDRLLFQRALGNLIENALAHTARGGRILLGVDRQGHLVRIAVSDSGSGIPTEHLPRLFERFHRVDASRSKNTGGVGLGLALLSRRRHHILGGVLLAADMPARADMAHGKIRQGAGPDDVLFALRYGNLIVHTGGGNGLLDGLFTLLGPELAELDLGMGSDGGQDLQEAGLPAGSLGNSTHGTTPEGRDRPRAGGGRVEKHNRPRTVRARNE